MTKLAKEARTFLLRKEDEVRFASARVALQLSCGIDLASALAAPGETRAAIVRRVERQIEKERLKGARRHWSYDLNRHIALMRTLDILTDVGPARIVRTKRKAAPPRRRA